MEIQILAKNNFERRKEDMRTMPEKGKDMLCIKTWKEPRPADIFKNGSTAV